MKLYAYNYNAKFYTSLSEIVVRTYCQNIEIIRVLTSVVYHQELDCFSNLYRKYTRIHLKTSDLNPAYRRTQIAEVKFIKLGMYATSNINAQIFIITNNIVVDLL